MKYLGVDYGKKKVGLAISEGLSVSPLKVLEISSLADALSKISHIIKSEEIDELVIGVPESGEARRMVEKFMKEIKEIEEIKVLGVDETLSSRNAINELIEQGSSQKKRKREDAVSATIILEEYLENNRHSEA